MPRRRPKFNPADHEVRCSVCNGKLLHEDAGKHVNRMPAPKRAKLPMLVRDRVDGEPVCPACYCLHETQARYERRKRQEKAAKRDKKTLKILYCAGEECGAELLGDSEGPWYAMLSKEDRSRWQFAHVVIDGRPYCAACKGRFGTDFAKDAPHNQKVTTLAEVDEFFGAIACMPEKSRRG